MQPEFHSGAVTRPLSAILQLAMMGCPALRARGELAAGACAPVLGWEEHRQLVITAFGDETFIEYRNGRHLPLPI